MLAGILGKSPYQESNMSRIRIHDLATFNVGEIKFVLRENLVEVVVIPAGSDDDLDGFTLQCFGPGQTRPSITWPPENKTETCIPQVEHASS